MLPGFNMGQMMVHRPAGGGALAISGTPVLTATEGTAYAGFTVSATGGTAPYTFSVASGALPTGITLNSSTGAVSGTPTVSGSFAGIVMRVTDNASATADLAAFTLEVEAAGILDGLSPTGAWSMSRDLLTAFAGSRYTDVSGAVSSWNDQSGNSRHMAQATAGNRPLVATAGPNSIACADFDGTDDILVGSIAISNFISASAGYLVVSFLADTITVNNANAWSNHAIIEDFGQFLGLHLRDTGSPDTISAYNWDGNADVAARVEINAGTANVAEWRHEGGNVYVRVNGGTEASAASGNTQLLTGQLRFGGASAWLDGKIFEVATFSTVPASGDRDAIVADFMTQVGI
ncbi:Ig domain-containing protein [Mesorhizobium sp. AaZ16]|uniref:Ig domain-containing protein n=1 Tax=Mesorhizobium sp. AaZ16 TaxID=3402289 RepID=UPI00374E3882